MEFHFSHNALPGSLELAYMGDTVYDLYVRSLLYEQADEHACLVGCYAAGNAQYYLLTF
jgi:23S rRNA maturation mini-RNase III